MTPTPTPPSGINLWTVATTILSAALIAALSGIFSMYGKQALLEERFNAHIARDAEKEAESKAHFTKIDAFTETTNQRLNSVDALKVSFDNLTRYAERDRR